MDCGGDSRHPSRLADPGPPNVGTERSSRYEVDLAPGAWSRVAAPDTVESPEYFVKEEVSSNALEGVLLQVERAWR